MSACKMAAFFIKRNDRKSWWAYERTASTCKPTSLPYFFNISRRFMESGSKTKHKWFRW